MDFLLEEEFSVTPDFSRKFLGVCDKALEFEGLCSVSHSVGHTDGEIDLVVVLSVRRGPDQVERVALLVEDKITAGFQPNQAERYRRFGNHGKTTARWEDYYTVLVAPHAYLSAGHGFDQAISYEEIGTWVCPDDVKRREFKQRRIAEAIAKKNTTGVKIVDPVITAFHAAYYENMKRFNERHGTDLSMPPPKGVYSGETWFFLKSRSLPPESGFRHRATAGAIELIFRNTPYEQTSALEEIIGTSEGVRRIYSGKYRQHVTLQMTVPKIFEFDDFEKVRANVDAALSGARALLDLFQRERSKFEDILIPARQAMKLSKRRPKLESD